jgi:uncharacterized membrane protein
MAQQRKYRAHHYRMYLRARWHRVTGGGFFPSAVAAGIGAVLAFGLKRLEDAYGSSLCTSTDTVRSLCFMTLDHAVTLQSAVALGVLGTVGVVFSILLVSLQLVSGQFSPRLVQAIFRDHRSKVLVALLVGVFVFSMASLFFTVVSSGHSSTAGITTLFVGIAGIIAGVVLVLMLYGVAQRQYIGAILDDAAKRTNKILRSGKSQGQRQRRILRKATLPYTVLENVGKFPGTLGQVYTIKSNYSGWVQQLSSRPLLEIGPRDSVLRLETRVGAFVSKGAPLASVWPITSREGRGQLTDEEKTRLDREVNLAAYLGTSRTMQDDADFGLRQITDVFLRAMSPAINDPSTAIEAMMRTATVLRTILVTAPPEQIEQRPERGIAVLRPWDLDAGEYMRHGLDQLRQHGFHDPAVAIALLRTITQLLETTEDERRLAADIQEKLEREARLRHLDLAREELLTQRETLIEAIEQRSDMSEKDLAYTLRGLNPQRPDLVVEREPELPPDLDAWASQGSGADAPDNH